MSNPSDPAFIHPPIIGITLVFGANASGRTEDELLSHALAVVAAALQAINNSHYYAWTVQAIPTTESPAFRLTPLPDQEIGAADMEELRRALVQQPTVLTASLYRADPL